MDSLSQDEMNEKRERKARRINFSSIPQMILLSGILVVVVRLLFEVAEGSQDFLGENLIYLGVLVILVQMYKWIACR